MFGINLIVETRVWVLIFVWIWFGILFHIWFSLNLPIENWPLGIHVHALAVAMHGKYTYTHHLGLVHAPIYSLPSLLIFISFPCFTDATHLASTIDPFLPWCCSKKKNFLPWSHIVLDFFPLLVVSTCDAKAHPRQLPGPTSQPSRASTSSTSTHWRTGQSRPKSLLHLPLPTRTDSSQA